MISSTVFKAYDIRGVIGETLDVVTAYSIGRAFGSEIYKSGGDSVVTARDGRLSSLELSTSLVQGLCSTGLDIIDIGMVTTPMAYFATNVPLQVDGKARNVDSCIIVTGSHNPSNYNGFKMVLRGKTIYGNKIQDLYERILSSRFEIGKGRVYRYDITDQYINRIVEDIKLQRSIKVVLDAGNGVAGAFAPRLFKMLGCEVIELFCDVDGHFPNHHPDPAHMDNLKDIIKVLSEREAEIGFAFDGDGDRLGVITNKGEIIFPDRQLMFFAEEILRRHPGSKVIYDVKCTRNLDSWVRKKGGEPVMWKTGHSLIKAKLRKTNALLAGEMSGHMFFKDRWYGFDDGIYTGARMLEILSRFENPSERLTSMPSSPCTPELHMKCLEGENLQLISRLKENANFIGAINVITIDGLRVEYPDGFGLVRSSNTAPMIVMRFEADNEDALNRIKRQFKELIFSEKPDAILPF